MVKNLFSKKYFTLSLLALLGVLAYANTFSVPFVFDDDAYVVNNPLIRSFHYFTHPADVIRLDTLSPTAFGSVLRYAFMTRILGYLSLALNYHLNGLDVTGYHIVNLLLHLANGALLFLVLRMLLGKDRYPSGENNPVTDWKTAIAVIVPILFVIHPIQTHAVTYITSRFVLIASFFFLLSLYLYVRSRLSDSPRRRYLFYACAVLSAIAAMLSKEFTFTLPFIIALCDITFFTGNTRERIRRLSPVAMTIFVIPSLVFIQQKSFGALDSTMRTITAADVSKISRGDYLLTQLRVMATYLRLLIFPVNQNLDHDFPVYHSLFTPPVFLSLLLLLALFGIAVFLFIRSTFNVQRSTTDSHSSLITLHPSRMIAFGILWFFITMSVESSIIPLGELAAEYRLYLPSIGLFIAFAAFVRICVVRIAPSPEARCRTFTGFFIAVSALLAVATFMRNSVWKDEISLWEDAARKSPAKLRPHQNLGTYYSMKGRLEDARRELLIALSIDPGNFEIHNNLGIVYRKLGDLDGAIREYTTALQLMPTDAMARYNLGNIYLGMGRYDEALQQYLQCLKTIPDYDELHNNLGIVYQKTGHFKEAREEYETALRLNPENVNVRNNLASLLRESGRYHGDE